MKGIRIDERDLLDRMRPVRVLSYETSCPKMSATTSSFTSPGWRMFPQSVQRCNFLRFSDETNDLVNVIH